MAEITVRQARAEDREAVLAFCAHTWEWGDYIENVWERWLSDPSGSLLVALVGKRPVGILHLQMLNATEAWQEGMRVDPAFRRQGIAHHLSLEAGAEAMRRGATTIRLLTDSTNTASIHMVEQAHWRQIGAYSIYTAEPLTSIPRHNVGLDEPVLATLADLDEIIEYLDVSSIFPAVGGIYYSDFIGYRISDTLLKGQIERGEIYLLKRWQRLDGVAIVVMREDWRGKYLSLGYIDGTTESISLLAYALRRKIAELGMEQVRAYVPDLMMVRDAFGAAEYEWDGHTFLTFERGLI
jgi:GNAT superfamily N-acetyltransferase